MQLYVGSCLVVSAEIAVAMVVPIENPTDFEVRGVISFLQADKILGYLAEEASSRVYLFRCTTMHVHILSGIYKRCCLSNFIGTSSSILHTVRTWHHQTFSCFQKWSALPVYPSQILKIWRMLLVDTWYDEGIHKLVPRYDKSLNVKGDYVE